MNLLFTFIKNIYMSMYFFFIMKSLTDFCKMVESGMDPCLGKLGYIFFINFIIILLFLSDPRSGKLGTLNEENDDYVLCISFHLSEVLQVTPMMD